MNQLEQLHLTGSLPALDYRALPRLRTLRLAGNLREWPAGLLALEALESADLTGVQIASLPDELFTGHERLWRRLRLNWKALEPQAFRKAFDYVQGNPAHLVDEPYIVAQHCERRLEALVPHVPAFAANALAAFSEDGLAGRALLDKVEALHAEYRAWDAHWLNGRAAMACASRASRCPPIIARRWRTGCVCAGVTLWLPGTRPASRWRVRREAVASR